MYRVVLDLSGSYVTSLHENTLIYMCKVLFPRFQAPLCLEPHDKSSISQILALQPRILNPLALNFISITFINPFQDLVSLIIVCVQ